MRRCDLILAFTLLFTSLQAVAWDRGDVDIFADHRAPGARELVSWSA